MLRNAISFLLLLLSSLLSAALLAQTVIHNAGEELFIDDNTVLYNTDGYEQRDGSELTVEGRLQVENLTAVGATPGDINNNDTIWVRTGFGGTNITYNPGANSRLMFVSLEPTFFYNNNASLTTANLEVNLPGASITFANGAASNGLIVDTELNLVDGVVDIVPTQGFVQFNGTNANLTAGDDNYVNGKFRRLGTGVLDFPIGTALEYHPARFNVTGGTNPVIEGLIIQNTTFSGTDSLGVTGEYAEESTNPLQYSFLQVGGTPIDSIENVQLAVYEGSQAFGSLSNADKKLASRVAYSPTSDGEFHSLGSTGISPVVLPREEITADSTMGTGLGYYMIARCQVLAGNAVPTLPAICLGEEVEIEVFDEETAFLVDYAWNSSTTLAGSYTAVPSAPNAEVLDLEDSLSTTRYFFARIEDQSPLCAARNTDTALVQITPGLQARLRAFLQGPYNTVSDQMNSAGPSGQLRNALEGQFLSATGSALNRMVTGATVADTMVDVVVVELRTATMLQTSDSAWINSNGYLTDFKTGGTSPAVQFCGPGAVDGNYFVLIRHRNHLPIMTNALNFFDSNDPVTYLDLSVAGNLESPNQNNIEIDAAPARIGMVMGNLVDYPWEFNAQVNALDYFEARVGNVLATPDTYERSDANVNGQLDSDDVTDLQPISDQLYSSFLPN